jgi:hypothetical protein
MGRDRIGWDTTGKTRTGLEKDEMQNRRTENKEAAQEVY